MKNLKPLFIKYYKVILINIAVFLGLTTSFHILGYLIMSHSNTLILDELKIIEAIEKKTLENGLSTINYNLRLYCEDAEFTSLNKDSIYKKIQFIKSFNSDYENIYVISQDSTLISGYIEDKNVLLQVPQIKNSFKGVYTISPPLTINGKDVILFSGPLKGDDSVIKGIISIAVNLDSLNKLIDTDSLYSDMEAYIVDETGTMITKSKYFNKDKQDININLTKIKINIDYNKTLPYINYTNRSVYGLYHDLNFNNWTLIIEKTTDFTDGLIREITKLYVFSLLLHAFLINKKLCFWLVKYKQTYSQKSKSI